MKKSKLKKNKAAKSKWIANNDLKVFLLSLLISTVIWTIMKLSDVNTYEYDVVLQYTEIPDDLLLINEPDSVVKLKLTSQGFNFFTNVFSGNQAISISMNQFDIRKSNYDDVFNYKISVDQLSKQIGEKLNVRNLGEIIEPDSILFRFSKYKTKDVPIKVNHNLEFRNNYQLYGKAKTNPEYVSVSGPMSIIDTMKFIATESFSVDKIGEDFEKTLSLIVPEDIILSHSKVDAIFKVANYTEIERKVKVQLINRVEDVKIKTFPDFVTISYVVAVNDNDKIDENSFVITATLDSLKLLRGDELIPELEKKPDFVRNLTIKDKTIDYIIIE